MIETVTEILEGDGDKADEHTVKKRKTAQDEKEPGELSSSDEVDSQGAMDTGQDLVSGEDEGADTEGKQVESNEVDVVAEKLSDNNIISAEVNKETAEDHDDKGVQKSEDATLRKEKNSSIGDSTNKDKKTEVKYTGKAKGDTECKDSKTDIIEEKEEEMIEWLDEDDYLFYLEEILVRIHKAFYSVYDQMKSSKSGKTSSEEKPKLPDLKTIIPYVKKKVLRGVNILFSGVFPTNSPPEKTRAYIVAKQLGANIHSQFVAKTSKEDKNGTTHVVAARGGTTKVKQASKHKGVFIVNPEWLWCCVDRWEKVEERLFPLSENGSYPYSEDSPVSVEKKSGDKRKRPCEESPDSDKSREKRSKMEEKDTERGAQQPQTFMDFDQEEEDIIRQPALRLDRKFSDSISPMMAFSHEDIVGMDKEIDDLCGSDSDDSDYNDPSEESKTDLALRKKVLHNLEDDSSSEDSMSGEFPKGWKKKWSPSDEERDDIEANARDEDDENNHAAELVENPERMFQYGGVSSSSESDSESVGSADEEIMALAAEKEFLS